MRSNKLSISNFYPVNVILNFTKKVSSVEREKGHLIYITKTVLYSNNYDINNYKKFRCIDNFVSVQILHIYNLELNLLKQNQTKKIK